MNARARDSSVVRARCLCPLLFSWGVERQRRKGLQSPVDPHIRGFSPDGALLAAGNDLHGTVRVWDIASQELVAEHVVGHGPVHRVAFAPSGELVLSCDGKLLRRPAHSPARPVHRREDLWKGGEISLAISASGDLMVAGYGRYEADPGEGAVVCWDLRERKRWSLPGHDGSSVFDVAITSAGGLIAAAGGPRYGPGFVKIWDARTRTLIGELPKGRIFSAGVAISPIGDRLAVLDSENVAVWEGIHGQPTLRWSRVAGRPLRLAFSPEGNVLAAGCFMGDRPSVFWDAETGDELETWAIDRAIMDVAFSPTGRLLASIDWSGRVEVFDRHQQQTVLSEHAHRSVGQAVAFSPDGRTLASASSGGQIKLWHLPTMAHVTTLSTGRKIAELMFFPDGQSLAVGLYDRTVEILHVDRDAEQFSIDGDGL